MRFRNTTPLDSRKLEDLFRQSAAGWPLDSVSVTVRPSRSSDFSGTCFYKTGRIFINLGRRLNYPYLLKTHLARARSGRGMWWREAYSLRLGDGYELALFVFMHEVYHWLVSRARRNTRQKEARCDRFAARALVQRFGVSVLDSQGLPVDQRDWDFQDLDGFVAAARLGCSRTAPPGGSRPIPVRAAMQAPPHHQPKSEVQWSLFLGTGSRGGGEIRENLADQA